MSRNIKEVAKELMGKSLNSFHLRTGLPQLEKNNEMQDGILDGILSQVDDAYIEKTEQSNVMHLDGSGDGVVVLDSIEGNTMVNLVGSSYGKNKNNHTTDTRIRRLGNINLKANTTYTLITTISDIANAPVNLDGEIYYADGTSDASFGFGSVSNNGIYKRVFTVPKDTKKIHVKIAQSHINNGKSFSTEKIMILEGDWIEKEILSYFEGLQSSFEEQVEDNKYKIEILSKNKNLIPKEYLHSMFKDTIKVDKDDKITVINNDGLGGYKSLNNKFIYAKPNSKLRFHAIFPQGTTLKGVALFILDDNNNQIFFNPNMTSNSYVEFTVPSNGRFKLGMSCKYQDTSVGDFYIMLTTTDEGIQTQYTPHKQNKIKLLINEPLRSVHNVKDRLCIKDNKLVVERNVFGRVFDGAEDLWLSKLTDSTINVGYGVSATLTESSLTLHMCDRLPNVAHNQWDKPTIGTHCKKTNIFFNIPLNWLGGNTINDVKQYLVNQYNQGTPMKIVHILNEPTYEEVLNEYGEPILLEGYENGTIYIDSTIVPTTTVRYTPKMQSFNTLNEVNDNNTMLTNDINDNIIPYMMDVDLMIMEKEMALPSQINIRKMEVLDMTSMQKRTQQMLERLIKGKTLSEQEAKDRVILYTDANKITVEQAEELMLLISEIYA